MKTNNRLKASVFFIICLFQFSFSSFSQKIYADEKGAYDGVKKIEVDGRFCDVTIIGENRSDVNFQGIIKGFSKGGGDYEIHHELNGDVLRVWVESPRSMWGTIEGKLMFKVPSETTIDITNSSGDVYCEGIVSTLMKIKASSGDVKLQQLATDLEVRTSSGDISVYEIKGNVISHSSSGDQEIAKLVGNIECETTSGDLTLEKINGDLDSRTTSGDLNFDGVQGKVKNVSTSGNFSIVNSKVILNLSSSSGDLKGQNLVLLGESFFNSTSGDIYMNLQNDFDQLSFELSASSGNIKVKDRRADDRFFQKNGEIWIHGKSSSGNQTFE